MYIKLAISQDISYWGNTGNIRTSHTGVVYKPNKHLPNEVCTSSERFQLNWVNVKSRFTHSYLLNRDSMLTSFIIKFKIRLCLRE